jgi:hypothetical protein
MRTAMLLVAVGQATVTVAAAWELLADRRRPPGQRRLPRYRLAFIGVTAVLAAVAFAAAFVLDSWRTPTEGRHRAAAAS